MRRARGLEFGSQIQHHSWGAVDRVAAHFAQRTGTVAPFACTGEFSLTPSAPFASTMSLTFSAERTLTPSPCFSISTNASPSALFRVNETPYAAVSLGRTLRY